MVASHVRRLRPGVLPSCSFALFLLTLYGAGWWWILKKDARAIAGPANPRPSAPRSITRAEWDALGGSRQLNYLRENFAPTLVFTVESDEWSKWVGRNDTGVFFFDSPALMEMEVQFENGMREIVRARGDWFRVGIRMVRFKNLSPYPAEVRVWNVVPWS